MTAGAPEAIGAAAAAPPDQWVALRALSPAFLAASPAFSASLPAAAARSAPEDLEEIYTDELKDLWSSNDQMRKVLIPRQTTLPV